MDWYWWVGIALVLVVVEMISLDLILIMFAGGAVAAAVASLLGGGPVVQIIAFGVTATVLLLALRPYLLSHLRKRVPLTETNVAALAGKVAVVVAAVSDEGGRVKLEGEVWSARAASPAVYAAGTDVRVVRIDGATAVVEAEPATSGGPDLRFPPRGVA